MARRPFNPDLALGGVGPAARAEAPKGVLTVWQITQRIKGAIENALPDTVHVVGQLSNAKRHSSGHFYFTLKDDRSELSCVMWRADAARLKFAPSDGLEVVVSGTVSVFERTGRYQLYARRMEPRGVGALELAFRQLCEKLQAEGLFDPQHKKPLPRYPQRIAVITSPTGAAVQDILDTLRRRFPCAAVHLCPVPVQGPGAGAAIARAIAAVNRSSAAHGGIDVMIVGRGGGSIEDLWAFNEEVVARAIFASTIPVISAVGHETDVTVADLVADVRAATPTAAAELAVPKREEVLEEIGFRAAALTRLLRHQVQVARARLAACASRPALADGAALVRERRRIIDDLSRRVASAESERLHRLQRRIAALALTVQRLHPQRFFAAQTNRVVQAEHRVRWSISRRLTVADRSFAGLQARLLRVGPQARLAVEGERAANLDRRLRRSVAEGLQRSRERMHGTEVRLRRGLGGELRRSRERLEGLEARLRALGHESALARGFSLTRLKKTGKLIRTAAELKEGDRLETQLQDGKIDSRVVDRQQADLFE